MLPAELSPRLLAARQTAAPTALRAAMGSPSTRSWEAPMSRSWTYTIPAPAEWLNSNQRRDRRRDNKTVQTWKDTSAVLARKARLPKLGACHLTVTLSFCDRRRRDAPNYYPTIKAVIDGLVVADVLDDDDNHHVRSLTIIPGAMVPRPRYGFDGQMVVTIREVTP